MPVRRARRAVGAQVAWRARLWLAGLLLAMLPVTLRAEVELPLGDPRESITVSAQQGRRWREGQYEVWVLQGSCRIHQGEMEAQSDEAVLWIDRVRATSGYPIKVICYLERNVLVEMGRRGAAPAPSGSRAPSLVGETWLGRLYTLDDIELRVPAAEGEPPVKPAVFQRGLEQRTPTGVVPTALQQPAPGGVPLVSGRRIRILPRSGTDLQFETFNNPQTDESVLVATMGVNVVIEGVLVEGVPSMGTLDLGRIEMQADNVVAWSSNVGGLNLFGESPAQPRVDPRELPLELYLEGNIVFRQGRRVIYADRMYYNVTRESGVVLNAEVLTPVQDYEGLVRLKADVLQQLDRQNFAAFGAAATSSRIGVPRYWLQSETITLQDTQAVRTNPLTGEALRDPVTGEADVEHQLLATSRNNFLYAASVPLLYWPVLATDLRKPSYYVDGVRIRNDNVFGFQTIVDLDAFQLLGIRNRPDNTKWSVSPFYFSDRGPGLGSMFTYSWDRFLGFEGPTQGLWDAFGIYDEGLDNLGADRPAVTFDSPWRGRVLGRHRQNLANDVQFTLEVGAITDRNFLEQYFENEWDLQKDQVTGIELKQLRGAGEWDFNAYVRLNSFFTQTEWLPRLDHYQYGFAIGEPLTWHEHTQVGYGRLRLASPPTDPADTAKFDYLAWEFEREGLRAASRQEIDLPLDLGPLKVVPYALGEVAYWGETINQDDVTRLYGQAGIRASLPIWAANPQARNFLFNVNGLAHKISLETDIFVAEADQHLAEFPLYDNLDDDSTEFFRRRFYFDTFGGAPGGNVPLQFDERYFALRSGLQRWVTAPTTEVADDLFYAEVALRQRLQTKRGLPGRERIVDWMVFDVQGTFFPNADRDNFGENFGLLSYEYRWHLGDRFTLLSDGFADFFPDGLKTVSAGGLLTRPGVGQLYLGYRSLEGPISANVINGSLAYRMSDKWIASGSILADVGDTGNTVENFSITRIGESVLLRVGVYYDKSRDTVGVQLAIEPRFLPSSRLGNIGGVQIPPAGALGLE